MINGTVSGVVGRDAELTTTDNGVAKLRFSVAVKVRNKGREPETVWVACAMFGTRAEALERHVLKGTRVCVVGKLRVWAHDGAAHIGLDVQELDLMGNGGRSDEQRPSPPRVPRNGQRQDDSAPDHSDLPF